MIVLAFSEQPQLLCIVSVYFLADLQMVSISLRVLARPNVSKLPDLYRQLGTDYDDRVLPSLCNEVCGGALILLLGLPLLWALISPADCHGQSHFVQKIP